MEKVTKKLEVYFYRTESGRDPVREWLSSLPREARKIIGDDILKVQYGWPIGKPLVDGLGRGLWEIRSRLDDGIARMIFYVEKDELVILHGFIKKTQRTPKQEIDLALKRKKLLV